MLTGLSFAMFTANSDLESKSRNPWIALNSRIATKSGCNKSELRLKAGDNRAWQDLPRQRRLSYQMPRL